MWVEDIDFVRRKGLGQDRHALLGNHDFVAETIIQLDQGLPLAWDSVSLIDPIPVEDQFHRTIRVVPDGWNGLRKTPLPIILARRSRHSAASGH